MHFDPRHVIVKIPCSLFEQFYQTAFNNLNSLNLSLHDPLVKLISEGISHESKCDGTQIVFIDRRFLVTDRNLTFCSFSNVPVPQNLAFRQSAPFNAGIYGDSGTPRSNVLPHRMLSPIYRIRQPFKDDPSWLLQRALQSINEWGEGNGELESLLKQNLRERSESGQYTKAAMIEDALNAINWSDSKALAKTALEILEMQSRRARHYQYLTSVVQQEMELQKESLLYRDRINILVQQLEAKAHK